tara:strand:- start:303 stop:1142 length:840 start_codon:yes stop_codon:yes gene_type:complete
MRRNNEDRLTGGHKPTPSEEAPQMTNPLDFITPTEFVELPSKGRYPTGHPLSGQENIEIRYMTAKDEDILTSRALLKQGVAIDRLIQNLINNKDISAKDLYIGDRNAIIVYARASAYGSIYKTNVTCPGCSETSAHKFNLEDHHTYDGTDWKDYEIEATDHGTFKTTLPLTKIVAEVRPLIGSDEAAMVREMKKDKKGENGLVTSQLKKFCVSFNGYKDKVTINKVIEHLTALDSRYLRAVFAAISPDLSIKSEFLCPSCDHEEEMSVPFGADFFWPDR